MRLIDANYLIYAIEHELWDWESVDGITASTVLKQTITDIKNQPTVDAVYQMWKTDDGQIHSQHMGLLIRCKECKFYSKGICWFDDSCYVWSDNDFCSRAERKEENETL